MLHCRTCSTRVVRTGVLGCWGSRVGLKWVKPSRDGLRAHCEIMRMKSSEVVSFFSAACASFESKFAIFSFAYLSSAPSFCAYDLTNGC